MKTFNTQLKDFSEYKFLRFDTKFLAAKLEGKFKGNIRLGQLFDTGRGRVINQQYCEENPGPYPLYSSQTDNNGIFGMIDTFDFDGEYLTWTTDGAKAGKVFYRNNKFSCTNVCGTAKLKNGNLPMEINLEFLPYYLNLITKYYVSIASGNPKLMNNVFEEITIPKIPISLQNSILSQIKPYENKIKELNEKLLSYVSIVDKVFSETFNIDINIRNKLHKGATYGTQTSTNNKFMFFNSSLHNLANTKGVRFSARSQNPIFDELEKTLKQNDCIRIFNITSETPHRGKSPQYASSGTIPVIKTAHLKNSEILISEDEFVFQDFFDKKISAQVKQGDILIASTGKPSIGKVDLVDKNVQLFSDGHLTILRIDEKKYNKQFLVYYLWSVFGTYQIEKFYVGSTNQIEIYPEDISNFIIPNFSLDKQKEIVDEIQNEILDQLKIRKEIEKISQEIDVIVSKSLSKIK